MTNSPTTSQLIAKGLYERRQKELKKQKETEDIKNLKPVTDEYLLSDESTKYLDEITDLLLSKHKDLPNEVKREVLKKASAKIDSEGVPEQKPRLVLEDILNELKTDYDF